MRVLRLVPLPLAVVLLALGGAGAALAAQPPNHNDPCANTLGRDSCGTTGVGSYETYKYGVRWFGDYRGAIPGVASTYCIDLNFWYPAAKYNYQPVASSTLVNRDSIVVTTLRQQELAYAIWNYGRTTDPNQAAAVMLYVHTLMGDGRPGEVSPSVLGPGVVSLFDTISTAAARYHGPYRIVAQLPPALSAGAHATATVRVLSASGEALPDTKVLLSATGVSGAPASLTTDASGVAQVMLTATGAGGIHVVLTAPQLASTLPAIYQATAGAAMTNGQRLAVPTSQSVTATLGSTVTKTQLRVASLASPSVLAVGHGSHDRVTVAGAGSGWHATVAVTAYGPFPTVGAISCDTAHSFWTGTIQADGPGSYSVGPVYFTKPGWYAYREVVPGSADVLGVASNCTDPLERVEVQVQPKAHTVVSAQTLKPGAQLSDTISVSGLDGQSANVQAALYGPFSSASAISCKVPIWTGTVTATTNGTVTTQPFALTVPGYYTYSEQISAQGFVRAATTPCGEASETAIVTATPAVDTEVASQLVVPGSPISDRLEVTGLGSLSTTVGVQLWGPFQTKGGISCAGTPYWSGTLTAKGNGQYQTPQVVVQRVGYYTFRESILPTTAIAGVTGECGAATETTLAEAQPTVTTVVQSAIVRPGSGLADLIHVTGLGQTKARITVQLFGPFGTSEGIRCTGTPAWQQTVTLPGDGNFRSPSVRIAKAGFYVFHEMVVGSALIKPATTSCAETAETSLGAPMIITGRGDVTTQVLAPTSGPAPTQVQIPSLGIQAPVSSIGIDLATGDLGVSPDIHRVGWWSDGAAPGSSSGAVLLAGHVDSATAGAGALFALKSARAGALVELTLSNGRTVTYKVESVQLYLKKNLPLDVFSRSGPPRLVIVTCGGPFDTTTRHYLDNVVLTAVPT